MAPPTRDAEAGPGGWRLARHALPLLARVPSRLLHGAHPRQTIRVCQFTPSLSGGGAEERIARVLASLPRDRFELSWMGFGRVQHRLTERAGSGVLVVPLPRDPSHGVEPGVIARIALVLGAIRPDVIHVHNWSTSLYGIMAARAAGVPVVIYGEGGRDAPAGPSRRRRALMRALAPHVDAFTAVCGFLGREVAAQWSVPLDRVHVIPNGVELSRLDRAPSRREARARLGVPEDMFLIGTIAGRFRAVKRLPLLIDAVGRIAARFPRVGLALVGDPLELEEELRWRARVRQIEGRTFLPGHIEGTAGVLQAFDLVVNCSVFEGASNAIIEAMGAGLPVVATAVGGTPELIEHETSGLLVPPDDVQALSDAIARLVEDGELRRRLGQGARAEISRVHTHERMLEAYADLYTRLGARGRGRSSWRRIGDLGRSLSALAGSAKAQA